MKPAHEPLRCATATCPACEAGTSKAPAPLQDHGWVEWKWKRAKDEPPTGPTSYVGSAFPEMPISSCLTCGAPIEYYNATWWQRGTCGSACPSTYAHHVPTEHLKAGTHDPGLCATCASLAPAEEEETVAVGDGQTYGGTFSIPSSPWAPTKWDTIATTTAASLYTGVVEDVAEDEETGLVRVWDADGTESGILLPEVADWEPFVTITDSVIMVTARDGHVHGWSLEGIRWEIVPWKAEDGG